MIYIGKEERENFYQVRYNSTWRLSWENILDMMQVILGDMTDFRFVGYLPIAGSEPVGITQIPEGLLHKVDAFKEERGALIISGKSKVYNSYITVGIYNQLRIVDIRINKTETELVNKFLAENEIFSTYLNSIEIGGYIRSAKRQGIQMTSDFLKISDPLSNEAIRFKSTCNELNVTPFE